MEPIFSPVAVATAAPAAVPFSTEEIRGMLTALAGVAGVLIVICIAFHILFAVLFGRIAKKKGYSGFGWGLLTLFFPVIGIIAIAIKPDLEARKLEEEYHKNMIREMKRLNQTMYGMMTGYVPENGQNNPY